MNTERALTEEGTTRIERAVSSERTVYSERVIATESTIFEERARRSEETGQDERAETIERANAQGAGRLRGGRHTTRAPANPPEGAVWGER